MIRILEAPALVSDPKHWLFHFNWAQIGTKVARIGPNKEGTILDHQHNFHTSLLMWWAILAQQP
jgi:hypothetical protein